MILVLFIRGEFQFHHNINLVFSREKLLFCSHFKVITKAFHSAILHPVACITYVTINTVQCSYFYYIIFLYSFLSLHISVISTIIKRYIQLSRNNRNYRSAMVTCSSKCCREAGKEVHVTWSSTFSCLWHDCHVFLRTQIYCCIFLIVPH
jgi:hypothetical protein